MNFLVAPTKPVQIVMLLIGLLCIGLAFFVIFLYKRKLQREKNDRGKFQTQEFQVKYKIFYFWGHVAYILVIFSLIIIGVVLLAVGFGALIK